MSDEFDAERCKEITELRVNRVLDELQQECGDQWVAIAIGGMVGVVARRLYQTLGSEEASRLLLTAHDEVLRLERDGGGRIQ